MVDYSRVRFYSEVQKGTAAYVEGVGMSRGIGRLEGMVGDKSRGTVVGMKDTVVGIDEMVDVEVLDCVGLGNSCATLPFVLSALSSMWRTCSRAPLRSF